MKNVAIYTACFGDHDQPIDLHGFEDQADLFCFTDSPILARTLTTWDVRRCRARFRQPRMDAKWYKMSACHLFPEHAWSIYLDSSIRFRKTEGFLEHCLDALSPLGALAFFSHPEGQRTIEEEAALSMSFEKYAGEPCAAQAAHYAGAGFPGGQLLAGGCIVRAMSPVASLFEKAWFDECVQWSVQDQVSLPYVLWKQGIRPGILPGSIYENEFFSRVWSGPNR